MKPPISPPLPTAIPSSSLEAMHLNAYLEYAVDDFTAAAEILQKLIRMDPLQAAYYFDLGLAHWHAEEKNEAAAAFEKAADLDPTFGDASYNAAVAARALKQDERARANFKRALKSDATLAINRLSGAWRKAFGGEAVEVLERYGWRIATKDFPAVHDAISFGMLRTGNFVGAADRLRRALALEKTAMRHGALGAVLRKSGDYSGAIAQFQEALRLDQRAIASVENLGAMLEQEQRFDEARVQYEKAVALDPNAIVAQAQLLSMNLLDGRLDRLADDHARLITALGKINLRNVSWETLAAIALHSLAWPLPPQVQRAMTRSINEQVNTIAAKQSRLVEPFQFGAIPRTERLRIGYLSAHLADQPFGAALAAVLAKHDRSRFEVHVFYASRKVDPQVDLFADSVEHFHRVTGNVVQLAEFLKSRQLDLLVYLDGYKSPGLMQVVALEMAHIQAFWLGHPGECEISAIDYLIADDVVAPPGTNSAYGAKILRLPQSIPAVAPADGPSTPTRHTLGLPDTAFVFCALAPVELIDYASFALWMRILAQVEGSFLWLLKGTRPDREKNLRAIASELGVEPQRLIFADAAKDRDAQRARLSCSDLLLDTVTVNAAETAADALAVGLPVLTIKGETFGSRLTAAELTAIDQMDMACDSHAAYVTQAVALAQAPATLAERRARLAQNLSRQRLFDVTAFCRGLEENLEKLMREQRSVGAPVRRMHTP